MTVRELRAALETLPGDAEVTVSVQPEDMGVGIARVHPESDRSGVVLVSDEEYLRRGDS